MTCHDRAPKTEKSSYLIDHSYKFGRQLSVSVKQS